MSNGIRLTSMYIYTQVFFAIECRFVLDFTLRSPDVPLAIRSITELDIHRAGNDLTTAT